MVCDDVSRRRKPETWSCFSSRSKNAHQLPVHPSVRLRLGLPPSARGAQTCRLQGLWAGRQGALPLLKTEHSQPGDGHFQGPRLSNLLQCTWRGRVAGTAHRDGRPASQCPLLGGRAVLAHRLQPPHRHGRKSLGADASHLEP